MKCLLTYSPVILENAEVELHGHIKSLVVQSYKLTPCVPVDLRHVVGTVHSGLEKGLARLR